MTRHLARNAAVMLALAVALLVVFEASGHRIPVLPGDASPGPVLVGAVLLAAGMTFVEQLVRRFNPYRGRFR